MAKPTMATGKGKTRDIAVDEWTPFLAAFTRENRGAHAVLEVLGEGVVTENRLFDGISADTKDGERSVWVAFGPTPGGHFTHGVHSVTAIRVRAATGDSGAAIEINSGDGATTLLILSRPEDYALPPAGSGENPSR